MEKSLWVNVLTIAIVVIGAALFVLEIETGVARLQLFSSLALIITLSVVFRYMYDTYRMAEEAWHPCASFFLTQCSAIPHDIIFVLRNHCKQSLECWCDLRATVYEQSVEIDGFYGGKHSFDLQPLSEMKGHFDINSVILAKAQSSIEKMEEEYNSENATKQLYMKIKFWYRVPNTKKIVENILQPHYYDFQRKLVITDF